LKTLCFQGFLLSDYVLAQSFIHLEMMCFSGTFSNHCLLFVFLLYLPCLLC